MIRKIERSDFKYKKELSFDPDDVNVRLQHFRVFELIKLIDYRILEDLEDDHIYPKKRDDFDSQYNESEEIDIESEDDLQRMPDLWNPIQKSRFIESLMINLPIPMFYLDGTTKPWRVIDGLQRLNTIHSFIAEKFKLQSLEYLGKQCDGLYYSSVDFPGYLKDRILNTELTAYVINPGTPEDVKYNIFQRINTGGLRLNGQEIRNAIFRGKPAQFTKELATIKIFKEATNEKVTSRRMIDREYTNRFIAFQIFKYEDYNGKMDLFLSEAMYNLYNRNENEIEELKALFKISMYRATKLFENFAFYRPKINGDWGKQPNKALFDTLSWNLLELNDYEFEKILNHKEAFKEKYFHFMNNNEAMFKSINDTTGSKTAVQNRFTLLNHFLKSYWNDYIY